MLKFKKKRKQTAKNVEELLREIRIINAQFEQNRVLGISENEHYLKNRLDRINFLLKDEYINEELSVVPFGGVKMDGGDLKDKSTEELLRIQTVQINKLIQKYTEFQVIDRRFKENISYNIEYIYGKVQFWYFITIISIIIGVIALFIR